jgi:hypothetical protein
MELFRVAGSSHWKLVLWAHVGPFTNRGGGCWQVINPVLALMPESIV